MQTQKIQVLPNPGTIIPKPIMVYFRSPNNDDVTKCDPNVVAEYNKILPVDVVTCDGWRELSRLLLDCPDQISINSNVFTSTDLATIKETVGMLQTKLKLAGLNIPIAIVVENDTPRHIVLQAKQLGLQGLIPYHGDWDSADTMAGLEALTNRQLHWPQHIINQLPNPEELPISIYFRGDADTYVNPDMQQQLKKNALCQVQFCTDWDNLGDALKKQPHQLIFYIGMLTRLDLSVTEIIEALQTRMQLSFVSVPIGVGIEPNTPMSVIKDLKQAGVFGLVPSAAHWGTVETVMALNSMANRVPYWPKHILDQLPGHPPKKISAKRTSINISPRQQQVLDLIKSRGLGNKQIARALGISESTVKMHVGDIMRAHGVKSRTQLAVLA